MYRSIGEGNVNSWLPMRDSKEYSSTADPDGKSRSRRRVG